MYHIEIKRDYNHVVINLEPYNKEVFCIHQQEVLDGWMKLLLLSPPLCDQQLPNMTRWKK